MTAPQDRQPATEWPQVLEYDAEGHWLILTDRLGPDEYGVSSIVARDVLHAFGLEAVARWEARAQLIAELREGAEAMLAEHCYCCDEGMLGGRLEQDSPSAPDTVTRAAVLALIEKVAG